MNLTKILQDATTPQKVLEEKKATEEKLQGDKQFASELDMQNYQQWLQHPVTQKLIVALELQQDRLIKSAVKLSCNCENAEERVSLQAYLYAVAQLEETLFNIKRTNK